MAAARLLFAVLLALLPAALRAAEQREAITAAQNPVRRVVSMLQMMQTKVEEEGEKEEELYKKFMCYCKTGSFTLGDSIGASETKIPAVGAEIAAGEAEQTKLKEEIKTAQTDRAAAKENMAEATAIREKEAATFAALKAQLESYISAIKAAVAALEKGMAGAFLQTGAADVLKRLAVEKQEFVDEVARKEILAFLSGSYAPKSGQITGILKEMGDTMAADLADATAVEEAAIKVYEELMAAKTKEVAALTAAIETKIERSGSLAVELVQMKNDLSETEAALIEDKKFFADLDKSCATKTAEWEERSKTRSEELVALADTIKVLNDDDALDLFKSTLPSPSASFVQVDISAKAMRAKALALVRQAAQVPGGHRTQLQLLALTLAGKKAGGFEKVIAMVDDMVKLLKDEQVDDDSKKEYCLMTFDFSDDKKKGLERKLSDANTAIATEEDGIATLTEEIAALTADIAALDKAVAEATEQRKEENKLFQEMIASDSAASELLGIAKNRLNQFYNPKLYKAAPKVELSAEDRIFVSEGGTPPPTEATGIAGTGVTVLAQVSAHSLVQSSDAPAPPPETWNAYAKKSDESTGVIAMIDLLIKDLDKEMAEGKTTEKDAQADYEEMMKDSAEKRVMDTKALADKGASKAGLEADLEASKSEKKATTKELAATLEYIASLHSECDWLLQYFETRKEARSGEVDSLVKAKAVLSGADYSLIQKSRGFLRRKQ
jgi:hypothetical protein